MSRTITLVGTGPNAGPSRPATKEETEASWATCVKQRSEGKGTCLSISMGGKSIDDKAAKLWCTWFERHCASIVSNGRKATAREINFSENRLTGEGLESICKTLIKLDIPVAVLKLYRNQIHQANAIVELISWGKGCIRELHLSHNCLDNQAVLKIILACATLTNAKGEQCYPQKETVPIWLRLEMNDKINGPKLGPELQTSLQRLGHSMRKCICEVDGNSYCCPGSCCRESSTVPAVHLTYLKLFTRCGPEAVAVKRIHPSIPSTPGAQSGQSRGWGQTAAPDVKPVQPDLEPEAAPTPAAPAPAIAPVKIQHEANFGASDFPSLSGDSGFPSLAPTKATKTAAKSKPSANLSTVPEAAAPTNVKTDRAPHPAEEKQQAQSESQDNAVPLQDEFPSLVQKQKGIRLKHNSLKSAKAAGARGPATPQRNGAATGYSAEACPPLAEMCPPPPSDACPPPPGLDDVPVKFTVPGLDLGFDEELEQPLKGAPPGLEAMLAEVSEDCAEGPAGSEGSTAEPETADYVSMLVIRDYDAEADGYLSVSKGEHVNVYLQFQGHGDAGCVWPTYVFAKVDTEDRHGWLPPHVAWERYYNENGRAWAHDASTGDFTWEDEINLK